MKARPVAAANIRTAGVRRRGWWRDFSWGADYRAAPDGQPTRENDIEDNTSGTMSVERSSNLVQDLHHASLLVADTGRALGFYCGVLGLELDPSRPSLPFAGAWLRVGTRQIHLLELPNPDPVTGRPEHGGRDRHVALLVADIDELCRRLEAADLLYTRSRSGRQALFCRDPDGNAVECIQA